MEPSACGRLMAHVWATFGPVGRLTCTLMCTKTHRLSWGKTSNSRAASATGLLRCGSFQGQLPPGERLEAHNTIVSGSFGQPPRGSLGQAGDALNARNLQTFD